MLYTGDYTHEISFPLGGIGSGCIGLDGTGRLVDWEIFNRPNKGSFNGFTHLAVKACNEQGVTARVLQGDMDKTYLGQYRSGWEEAPYGVGMPQRQMGGFPHFSRHSFCGEFPVARIDFADPGFPAAVSLHAFNPFIPLDAKNSSIPGAFFAVELTNVAPCETAYQVAFSVRNPFAQGKNVAAKKEGLSLLTLQNIGDASDAPAYGDLTVATDCPDSLCQPYWYRGEWMDAIVTFWNEFCGTNDLKCREYDMPPRPGQQDTGTLVAKITLQPGETRRVRFILSWNVPNAYNYWEPYRDEQGKDITWKNYYATVFADSAASAVYGLQNWDGLWDKTLAFKNALFAVSLDPAMIEAASANLAVLKSPTVLRLQDGSFWGWEGVIDDRGSCEGTCQHVWNYAYALCYLFPELERSVREAECTYGTMASGKTVFRLKLPYGRHPWGFRACVDGQMGTVLKCYREWKISGRDDWLREHWDWIKTILAYAWSDENEDAWDRDKDGVLEGRQHHTLDMELFGPSSWLQSMYLAALKAAAEMAAYLGETEKAADYTAVYESGRHYTAAHLFNGKWFVQNIDLTDKPLLERFGAAESYWNEEACEIKYQIGDGSAIDQMLGQWHACLLGLGDVFDKQQVQAALASMWESNFKPSMREFVNPWRLFAVNDEAGTVMCDYPAGSYKPAIPLPYCEECMTGFEYVFAGLLVAYGHPDRAVQVVKAIRQRYDGKKRNPWSEIECGSNYARSMASFALLPLFAGFVYDMPRQHMGFAPVEQQDTFNFFWCLEPGWGSFVRQGSMMRLTVAAGVVSLRSFAVPFVEAVQEVQVDGKPIPFTFEKGVLQFALQQVTKSLEVLV